MGDKHLLATIFVFAFVLTGIQSDDCDTYDDNGLCLEQCPDDTILFTSDCVTPTMSQRTCRRPRSRSLGTLCDYTRCDCQRPKVYDEAAKKCVRLKECSDQSNVKEGEVM